MFGTFGVWDKSLDFRIFLGHMALGQNVIGTIHLWAERFWDNSPREKRYWDKRYRENHQGTISLGLFTVHREKSAAIIKTTFKAVYLYSFLLFNTH